MGMRAALQEFFGEKFFRDKVTFDKDVVFKRTVTAYSPVASEPSLGTLHPHYKELVTNATYVAAGNTTIDVSGEVPAGARTIYVWIQHKSAVLNADLYPFTSLNVPVGAFLVARNPVANGYGHATGIITLSSTRTFYLVYSQAMTEVYVRMFYYSL
jgi:hypothetical protein